MKHNGKGRVLWNTTFRQETTSAAVGFLLTWVFFLEKSLIIMDEIGRGTSTFDGMALAQAIIEYLHDTGKSRILFATHYHQLSILENSLKRVCGHFSPSPFSPSTSKTCPNSLKSTLFTMEQGISPIRQICSHKTFLLTLARCHLLHASHCSTIIYFFGL